MQALSLGKKAALATAIMLALVIMFAPVAAQTSVTIKVLKDGDPVSGVLVEVYDSDNTKVASGTTDTNGTVTFSLADGKYKAYAYYKGKVYAKSFKVPDDTEVKIELSMLSTTAWTANLIWLGIGAGLAFVVLILIGALGGGRKIRLGQTNPAVIAWLILIGGVMAFTGVLVQQGYITADQAVLAGIIAVFIGLILPMITGKIKRK